jgi:hypothetical protein
MTEPIPINDLKFGVELECMIPRGTSPDHAALAAHITAGGILCYAEGYNHTTRSHWKVVSDSTVDAEVVSPPLPGTAASLAQVAQVCDLMTAYGCRVSRSCGTHVHVGVKDRFENQVGFFKELVRTYAKFQPIFDQLVAPSRRGTNCGYARPIIWTDAVANATTLRGLAQIISAGHFTNPNIWDAYSRHGTVEFRQHQGTLNGEKINNWIRLCLRLVAHAARNTERASTTTDPPQLILPREPAFTDPPDLSTATPVPDQDLTAFNRRHYGRSWVIGHIGRCPRRSGRG